MPTYDHAYQEVIAEGSDALLLMYSNDEELEAACQTWTKVWLTEGLQQILVDASLYIPDPDGGRMFDAHERSLNPPEHYCFRTKH
ncbi:MAG TPA: hypothetical protein VFX17_00495 [Patescibacteria group bacterium]|nr:hypothetical protein [Patescibacteria group bacterium]